uniref:PDZ domain-containing protein n=1 Tax=Mola mola TaxID=94237 RepID=A0A3Q3WGU6_MOLML
MLRLVIPRSDQLLFDQYTSEGLYLKTDVLPGNGSPEYLGEDGDSALQKYVSCIQELHRTSGCPDGVISPAEPSAPVAKQFSEGNFGDVRQITLTRSKSHEGLGFSIRGGSEHGVEIYVSLVEPNSSAEKEGLRVGDQILEVNGQSFVIISHDEAVHILKTGQHLLMKVRDVGRLPHARTLVDETKWIGGQSIAETNATANPSTIVNNNVNAGIHTYICASTCTSR